MNDQMTTTTTTTTDETTTEQQQDQQPQPRTLAEILAARIRKLDRDKREADKLAQRKLEGMRADAITHFTARYETMFPQSLRDALAATIGYDTTSSTDAYDEKIERGPFATFEHDGDPWMIRSDYYYGDATWFLEGPNDYTANLGADYDYNSPAGPLLDALNAYPHWLAGKQQREREKAEKATAAQATAANATPTQQECPIYAYVAGDDPGHHGMLHTQSRVWLEIATPDTADERLAYERLDRLMAAIVDWSDTWLLITLNDDATCQRLIPIARVVSIQPRA